MEDYIVVVTQDYSWLFICFIIISNYFLERSSLVCAYQVLFLGKIVKIE